MENEKINNLCFGSWFKANLIYYNIFVIVTAFVFSLELGDDRFDLIVWISVAVIAVISGLTSLGRKSGVNNFLVLSAFLLSSVIIAILNTLKPVSGEELYDPSVRIISSIFVNHMRAFFIFVVSSFVSLSIFIARFVWSNRKNLDDMKW
ncbi:MAG: hypothetical protein COV70_00430 [Parcubacteria group bacterium CG11_big_fil_rev_8_21_14_0_20_39_22]|nr:MAG: hypothetical protein COV70_00430 [Parcubacteria group bacterium CG11_big_fil_rev_8_21_14_0_20_39_22]